MRFRAVCDPLKRRVQITDNLGARRIVQTKLQGSESIDDFTALLFTAHRSLFTVSWLFQVRRVA